MSEIRTINLGGINCYLMKGDNDFVLIDTGISARRAALLKALEDAGCRPGKLRLIVLTHGDTDHVDNAAYLREKYGAKIAMHQADAGMIERGDMSWNRKAKPDRISVIFRIMSGAASLFSKPGKFSTFAPDIYLEDGQDLSEYGCDARVLHLPGHSKGSIGVLTSGRDLFCGDLLYNMPGFGFIDDLADFNASIQKLKSLDIRTVYPGHGKPFVMAARLRSLLR